MFRNFWKEKKKYYFLLAAMVLLSFASSYGIYLTEKSLNPRIDQLSELLYWWIASLTTIGNGGYPITSTGQILGVITMLSGSFVYLAIFSELIFFLKSKADERFKGISHYSGKNQVVILGYNNLALGLITFLDTVLRAEIDIVLITSAIETNPFVDRVKFIKMNPLMFNSLQNANIQDASIAFLLSQDEITEKKSDLNVLLLGAMIEEIEKNIFTMVEVNNMDNLEEIQKFNIDSVFSFEELVEDTRSTPSESIILKRIPDAVKESILKDFYS